jgi:hypothetical protein
MAQDPGASSSLMLVNGTIAGQAVSPTSRVVNVLPGAALSGQFVVQINSTWPSGTVMSMGMTPTWGDHSSSFIDLGGFATPTAVGGLPLTIPVNLTVPSTPGTYYIIAAFRSEVSAAQVMSGTLSVLGAAYWNSGYDIADWSASTIAGANANGTVQAPVMVNFWWPANFDLFYVPATAITVVVGNGPPPPADPGSNSSLQLVSGTISGQNVLPSSRTITVTQGASLSGQIMVNINSAWTAGTTMSMGVTPTWGDHATSYTDLGAFTTPAIGLARVIPINLTAPSTAGTYYIIAAFRSESSAAQVVSCTATAAGAPVWNNGDDVADWSAPTIATADAAGTVLVNYLGAGGNLPVFVPATAITVVVVGAPPPPADPGASSTLRLVNGTIAGQNVSPGNPSIRVEPGTAFNGQFSVQINSAWTAGTVVTMAMTPTWGGRTTSYIDLGHLATPVAGSIANIPINLNAPGSPGTYYIIAAFKDEPTAAQVMSCTDVSAGSVLWNNGDDVGDWSPSTLATANANGTVLVDFLYSSGNSPHYVPATVIIVQVVPNDPGSRSQLELDPNQLSTIAGQAVTSSNRTINVRPGASLTGQLNVLIKSDWDPYAIMSMGVTPTWGPHSTSFTDLGTFTSPVFMGRNIPINLTAPTRPGTYYIIAAFGSETTAAQLMSCTEGEVGSPDWNNGDDIADWAPSRIRQANNTGVTFVDYLGMSGNDPHWIPATAITVVVQQTEWHGDFNGDGKMDVLWRNSDTGQLTIWLMGGLAPISIGSPGTVADIDWTIQGLADFNGDGKTDILWRHARSGQLYIWFMDGTNATSEVSIGTVFDSSWVIERLGDFNGDGKADILWRNTLTGQVNVWLMNGAITLAMASPGTISDLDWQIQDLADFNGDGKADILWRKVTTGELWVWLMNGTNILFSDGLGLPAGWKFQATGDFNGDGKSDILWLNSSTGEMGIWLMDSLIARQANIPGALTGTGWRFQGLADFNGDGKADILFRNDTTGEMQVWLIDGTSAIGHGTPGSVPDSNWQVRSLGNFNGGNKAGILWFNRVTGLTNIWLMDGTTLTFQGSPGSFDSLFWQIQK